jgi:hypothetical protein
MENTMDIQGIKYDGEDFYCTCDECGDIVQVFACDVGVHAECSCEPVCMDWFDLTIKDLEILKREEIKVKIPKGFMNTSISTDNRLIADTNDSANWDTISFPLPNGPWKIGGYNNENTTLTLFKDI